MRPGASTWASAPAIRRRASSRRPRFPAFGRPTCPTRSRSTRCSPAASTSPRRRRSFYLDENTQQYRLGPAFRREAQNVGGFYAQDQWRVSPKLTFNYGLRWEFSGAATNPNEVYSRPTLADSVGPVDRGRSSRACSTAWRTRRFCCARSLTRRDSNNPAPNVGVAWHPDKPEGLLGTILGQTRLSRQLRRELLRRRA